MDWRPREVLRGGCQRNSSHQTESVRCHQICMRTEGRENHRGKWKCFVFVCFFPRGKYFQRVFLILQLNGLFLNLTIDAERMLRNLNTIFFR